MTLPRRTWYCITESFGRDPGQETPKVTPLPPPSTGTKEAAANTAAADTATDDTATANTAATDTAAANIAAANTAAANTAAANTTAADTAATDTAATDTAAANNAAASAGQNNFSLGQEQGAAIAAAVDILDYQEMAAEQGKSPAPVAHSKRKGLGHDPGKENYSI